MAPNSLKCSDKSLADWHNRRGDKERRSVSVNGRSGFLTLISKRTRSALDGELILPGASKQIPLKVYFPSAWESLAHFHSNFKW